MKKYKNNFSEQRSELIIWAIKDLWYGLVIFRYPICCVLQFAKETLNNKLPCQKRQRKYKRKYNPSKWLYVPCDKCLKGKEL